MATKIIHSKQTDKQNGFFLKKDCAHIKKGGEKGIPAGTLYIVNRYVHEVAFSPSPPGFRDADFSKKRDTSNGWNARRCLQKRADFVLGYSLSLRLWERTLRGAKVCVPTSSSSRTLNTRTSSCPFSTLPSITVG